jgi:histidine triad (HIT) family protein
MEEHTIFHKILDREIPADIVYEDDESLAFKDINPKAPTHLLFIPKVFAPSIADLTDETAYLPGMLIQKARAFAAEHNINGYKLIFHVGKGGGQEVFYLHLHFMSEEGVED